LKKSRRLYKKDRSLKLMNTDELYTQIDGLLDEYDIIYSLDDIESLELPDLLQGLHDIFVSRITAPFIFLGLITAVIIFTSLVKNMNSTVIPGKSGIADMAGLLTAVAVLIQPLTELYSEVCDTVIKCGEFMNLFVPIFAGICAVSGNISALGTYNLIVLGMSQIIVWISDNYLIPFLMATTALSITGSIYNSKISGGFVKFISSTVKWVLTVGMGIFVGFLTLKCTVGASADTFATKTVKSLISNCVPVVGGAVSDAYSTFKGSMGIIKSTAGMAGIIASVLIFIPPVIEIVAFRIVMKIGVLFSDIFSADSIGNFLRGLESGLSTALSIIICFALIFIISTAILMKTNTV